MTEPNPFNYRLPGNERRFDIKAMMKDPVLWKIIHDRAVDFICKVEGIRK